jgi:5'-nucleotidase
VSIRNHPLNRVLLTNDDGIDAPGLAILEAAAASVAHEVWVVAPLHDQSGVSHAISLHNPLRVTRQGTRRFAVAGTPGDCVAIAVEELMKDSLPDFLFSGINRGSNLGVETVFSGTVGAAMAGLLMGIRSIALSQVFTSPQPVRWETATALVPEVLRRLTQMDWPERACLNVNFPDVPPNEAGAMTFTRQGAGLMEGMRVSLLEETPDHRDYRLNFRKGKPTNLPESETAIVLAGGTSVTPLQFERTNETALDLLKNQRS